MCTLNEAPELIIVVFVSVVKELSVNEKQRKWWVVTEESQVIGIC